MKHLSNPDRNREASHPVDVARIINILQCHAGISSRISGGSSPSHCGFSAVPSKIEDVLNGSKPPVAAASRVFASNASRSSLLSG